MTDCLVCFCDDTRGAIRQALFELWEAQERAWERWFTAAVDAILVLWTITLLPILSRLPSN